MTTAVADIPTHDFSGGDIYAGAGGETDHLAAAVLRALGRSFRNQFSMSAGNAFWLGLITFGLAPLWKLSRQFSDYVTFEKQQFWHLAEWLRVRRGGEEAVALHRQVGRVRRGVFLRLLMNLCVIFLVIFVIRQIGDRFTLNRLIDNTYRLHQNWGRPTNIWKCWIVLLAVAYTLHAARVALHHRAVGRFVDRFNAVMRREGLAGVSMPEMESGAFFSGWFWTGAILAWFGALWSIPMALAGAMQRRYVNGTSTRLRAEMLERVRAMLQQRRPAVAVPNYTIHSRRCGNHLCRATLRASAQFCPRCGASTHTMSEVA